MTQCMANPIFDSDPHAVYGDLKAWVTDPPGMVNRLTDGARVTAKVALDMTIEIDLAMRTRWPGSKYIYVHDFSLATGYDEDALRILVEWGRNSMKDVAAIIVVIAATSTFPVKVAVNAGRVALKIFGVPMEISESVDEVIERYKLRPASL
jgi:hypothetical protein